MDVNEVISKLSPEEKANLLKQLTTTGPTDVKKLAAEATPAEKAAMLTALGQTAAVPVDLNDINGASVLQRDKDGNLVQDPANIKKFANAILAAMPKN